MIVLILFLGVSMTMLASGNVFQYINSERYFHATVYVVKPSPEREKFLEANYRWKYAHDFISELPASVHHHILLDLILTWVIKETDFGLGDFVRPQDFLERRLTFPNHKPQKAAYGLLALDGRESMTLVVTDVFQVSFGPKWNSEDNQFHLWWGDWLLHITTFRQVAISPRHLIILAFTYEDPDIFRPTDYREGLLMAPHLTFILQIVQGSSPSLKVTKSWMPCFHCENHRRSYLNGHYLLGTLNETLYKGINNGFGQESGGLSFYADAVPGLNFMDNTNCGHPWKLLYRVYDKNGNEPCREPRALTTRIIAEALNLTTSFGGKLLPEYTNHYNDVQLNTIFMNENLYKYMTSPDVHQMVLWDYSQYVFKYCSDESSYDVQNIFEILGRPFDIDTWICLLIVIVSLFVFFMKEGGFRNRPSCFQHIMELAELLLQRSIQKVNQIRVTALFVFFFIEFFYMGSVTECIIAPPARHIMETLSEALQSGYKIESDYSFNQGIEPIKMQLWNEGFRHSLIRKDNSFDPKYFKTTEDGPLFKKNLSPSSWFSFEGKSHLRSFHSKGGQICDYVSRAYGQRTSIIRVYSPFMDRVGTLLQVILFDSGIRSFWMRLTSFQSSAFRVKELKDISKVFVLQFHDDRFQAILTFSLISLSTACVVLFLEIILVAKIRKNAYIYIRTVWNMFLNRARVTWDRLIFQRVWPFRYN